MSEEEKNQFLSDLRTDNELDAIYKSETEKFNSVNFSPEVDHQYFVNMIPNVREKIDSQKAKKWYFSAPMKFAYTMILLIAVGINFINFENGSFEQNFSIFTDSTEINQFLAEDSDLLNDLLEEDFSTNYDLAGLLEEETNTDDNLLLALSSKENYTDVFNHNSTLFEEIEKYSVTEEEINEILQDLSSEVNL